MKYMIIWCKIQVIINPILFNTRWYASYLLLFRLFIDGQLGAHPLLGGVYSLVNLATVKLVFNLSVSLFKINRHVRLSVSLCVQKDLATLSQYYDIILVYSETYHSSRAGL